MRRILLSSLVAALLGPGLAAAQVSAEFRVDLPVVLPPMVVIQPGIQVVPDVDEEVFYSNGYYWVRRDDRWWRSRSHRGGWVVVRPAGVPPGLARIPPGQYRRWHAPPGHGERKERWREERREAKRERKEWKQERKEERREDREHRDHGRGHD